MNLPQMSLQGVIIDEYTQANAAYSNAKPLVNSLLMVFHLKNTLKNLVTDIAGSGTEFQRFTSSLQPFLLMKMAVKS